ncbi:hypothetical protein [Paraburkholderia sp. CI3]|uniref:hypothetical protein n=1 Tax=Paraburkholderia sp. CI3 TaxID=2991060 RepID=UPI003D216B43
MKTGEQSLRFVVEKWLGLQLSESARVTALGRPRSGKGRFVCVETVHGSERLALFFFRHDDGCWKVFPPAPALPEMALERLFA